MTTVSDLCLAMESIAPRHLAADWDNTGLLLGCPDAAVSRVLVCIDLTEPVIAEAIEAGVDAIVAYHPAIFEPIQRVTTRDAHGRVVLAAAAAGIAVYSPHSALDAAPGGMGDWLALAIGPGTLGPLEHAVANRPTETHKVVTYVPKDHLDAVRSAMAGAGAGRVGAYGECSTAISSAGTFRGDAGSSPAIGAAGRLETVDECRLMMVCGDGDLPAVTAALESAHPYEEPPIHIVPLRPRPMSGAGIGRVLHLDEPRSLTSIIESVKSRLGVSGLRLAGPDGDVAVAACCPGAGGSLLAAAEAAGATLYLTGEMRHHDVLAAAARGTRILLAGHTHTERGYMPLLRDRLRTDLPVEVLVSQRDTCPWRAV
ncbi:MAG: Nif3-like dinuclear metal center hexameric protein [Phycisphaerales bacterium]|jgi:dinuclear metal center YbgI/SA1388 family protein|nr:Nif3-like dinuclear metal center hexameric protein [Phycisphaerales bacterium]